MNVIAQIPNLAIQSQQGEGMLVIPILISIQRPIPDKGEATNRAEGATDRLERVPGAGWMG
jgi:hypothetical protein